MSVEDRSFEERLARLPPELRELYHTMVKYRRAFPRFSGRMHEVPMPPERASKPEPSVEPEPPRKEAKGFSTPAPLGPPPGIQWIDAMCQAADARERQERMIDQLIRLKNLSGGGSK
jgi:hypothetical protein